MLVVRTAIGPSAIHGIGVFAEEPISKGTVIWRYCPPFDQVISEQDVNKLPDVGRAFLETYAYRSKDLNGQILLCGDDARFLNHSDDPNTEDQLFLTIASRDIQQGEEITCDYRDFCTDWRGHIDD